MPDRAGLPAACPANLGARLRVRRPDGAVTAGLPEPAAVRVPCLPQLRAAIPVRVRLRDPDAGAATALRSDDPSLGPLRGHRRSRLARPPTSAVPGARSDPTGGLRDRAPVRVLVLRAVDHDGEPGTFRAPGSPFLLNVRLW